VGGAETHVRIHVLVNNRFQFNYKYTLFSVKTQAVSKCLTRIPGVPSPSLKTVMAGVIRTENSGTDGKGVDGSHSEGKRYRAQEVCLFV